MAWWMWTGMTAAHIHPDDYLSLILSEKPAFKPGTHYTYTDAAYYLLSRIITVVTGKNADAFILEHLLNPMGFSHHRLASMPKRVHDWGRQACMHAPVIW